MHDKSMSASRAALGHGTGWQATKCEVCTENEKVDYDVKLWREWSSQKCGTCHEMSKELLLWPQGQALSWTGYGAPRWGAIGCIGFNRPAQLINATKCQDSRQATCDARALSVPAMHIVSDDSSAL
jgi:hypothetical protein